MNKTFKYGGGNTIHSNNGLDVEVDKDGTVVAVWFRCMMLPFEQVNVNDERAKSMRDTDGLHGIDAINFIEKDNK